MARHGIFYSLFGIILIQLCVLATEDADKLSLDDGTKDMSENDAEHVNEDDNDKVDQQWFESKYFPGPFIKKRSLDDSDMYAYGAPGYDMMNDDLGYGEYMYDEDTPILADKRQASRWKYIYQKLNNLNRNSKRSPLRWKLIYQKLHSLDNSASKRGAGRWKNMNWMLNRGGDRRLEAPEEHSLQKRFIGRWKNNNWLWRQYQERNI